MVDRRMIWTVIATLVLAQACAPGEETGEDANVTETKTATPTLGAGLLPISVLVAHRVADYEAWKTVFDDHLQSRKDASCLGHYLKRDLDDPRMVYVFCMATDADQLRAFLASDDLAEAMNRAGVEGAPNITLMNSMSRNLVSGRMLPGIIVKHRVKDYDNWRTIYDDFDDFRRRSGIVGDAVGRDLGDPNHVIVYHQGNDLDALHAFVESEELADAMRRAGVLGKPDIRFIRVVGFADY